LENNIFNGSTVTGHNTTGAVPAPPVN